MDTVSTKPVKGLRVLVVDDHEEQRIILRDLLEFHGYVVETAAHGEAALPLVRRAALVMTDLRMPVMDGLALLQAIRTMTGGGPPVIVLSADHGRESEILAAGASAFAAKPVRDLSGLLDRIAALIAAS